MNAVERIKRDARAKLEAYRTVARHAQETGGTLVSDDGIEWFVSVAKDGARHDDIDVSEHRRADDVARRRSERRSRRFGR